MVKAYSHCDTNIAMRNFFFCIENLTDMKMDLKLLYYTRVNV